MGLKVLIGFIYAVYCIHVLPPYLFPEQNNGTMAVTARDEYNKNAMGQANHSRMQIASINSDNINYTFVIENRPTGN